MGTFELNYEGGSEVLKVLAADIIKEVTVQIGTDADEGAKVADFSTIDDRVTDRFVGIVTVPAHRQATDGALTRAANASGLEVTMYETKPRTRRPKK